jgi:hypothetical protein
MTNLNGNSALHIACIKGYIRIVQYLIRSNLDVDQGNKEGRKPLQLACANGHLDIVQYLLLYGGVNKNNADGNGDIPLLIACANGHLDIAKYLITVALVIFDIKDTTYGRNCLHWACVNDHKDLALFLATETNIDLFANDNDGKKAFELTTNPDIADIIKSAISRIAETGSRRIKTKMSIFKTGARGPNDVSTRQRSSTLSAVKLNQNTTNMNTTSQPKPTPPTPPAYVPQNIPPSPPQQNTTTTTTTTNTQSNVQVMSSEQDANLNSTVDLLTVAVPPPVTSTSITPLQPIRVSLPPPPNSLPPPPAAIRAPKITPPSPSPTISKDKDFEFNTSINQSFATFPQTMSPQISENDRKSVPLNMEFNPFNNAPTVNTDENINFNVNTNNSNNNLFPTSTGI